MPPRQKPDKGGDEDLAQLRAALPELVYTLDEALTYALSPNLQLDLGGNFSLNGVVPRTQLYMGLSQRF